MRFVSFAVLMTLAACGTPPPPCGPTTCSGCCSAQGECLTGATTQSCGARGNQCVSCNENESCNVGVCLATFTPRPEEHFDAGATTDDAGVPDAGEGDAGELDAGVSDAGATDAGATDAGLPPDAGSQPVVDAGVVDAGTSDCAGTLAPCSGTCRDLRADVENCGSCGRVCGSGQVCNQGTCAPLPMDCTLATCGAGYSCDPLTRRCVTGCRLSTDCPMGATCQQGQCQCASMNHACGQTCVSNQAVTSCGARCTTCPQPAANGVASCVAGACAFACTPGFVASGGTCVDVNECLVNNGGCGSSITSSCTNTPGGRTCGCAAGYASADGGVCSDVDECATNNGGCSSNATCTNTAGARTCACQPGWVGDGIVFRSQPSSQYVQSTLVASCATLTSPVTLLGPATTPAIGDETTSSTVPLPFQFWHFGVPVTHLSVQTNGLMQLHTSASGVGMASTFLHIGTPLPATSGPNGFIAPLWIDLFTRPMSRVAAQTFGAPGFRVHVIEWRDVWERAPTIGVNFQVKLFEDTGAVEVHWCSVPPLSRSPVVALENLTGTAVSQYLGPASTGGGVRFQP